MNSKVYKWCAVPQCHNTSKKTPNKLFVYVPHNKSMRNKWFNLARRDPKSVCLNSPIYFCEDHFDLPNDMVNYMEYHVMGSVSQVRMKAGCIPSKLACQSNKEQPYVLKKQEKLLIEECKNDLEDNRNIIRHLELENLSTGSSGQASEWNGLKQDHRNPTKSQECSDDDDDDDGILKKIKLENDSDLSPHNLMPSASDFNEDNDKLHFEETSENAVMENPFQDGQQIKLEYDESYETTEISPSNLVPSCSSASFFNHKDTEQIENIVPNTPKEESFAIVNDAIINFFLSMADTVKQLPQDLQVLAKRKVLHEVSECEMMAINRLSEKDS